MTLSKGDIVVDIEALVDSGSDRNIFDAEYAKILGIDDISENGIETSIIGVTGEKRTGYTHDIVLGFSDYQINTNIVFLEKMPDSCKAILGQEASLMSIRFDSDIQKRCSISLLDSKINTTHPPQTSTHLRLCNNVNRLALGHLERHVLSDVHLYWRGSLYEGTQV